MKEPREWDEQYLLSLPIGEFDWLEVKGRRGLDLTLPEVREQHVKEILSKAISAFANSGGGKIVLGLSNPKTNWQIDDGGIDLSVKKPSTREWLENIISTLVDFPLTSFNVYVIQNTGSNSQISLGRGVFIIDIPDSDLAPHQAIVDHIYYARVGGKSQPIPHRLVADIFGRRQYPKIQLGFSIEITNTVYDDILGSTTSSNPFRKFKLLIKAINEGRVYAQYVNIRVHVPAILLNSLFLEMYEQDSEYELRNGMEYVPLTRRNTKRDIVKWQGLGQKEYGSSWFDPVLPSLSFEWDQELIGEFDKVTHGDLRIFWEAYADNAPGQTGNLFIRDIELLDKSWKQD